MGLLVVPLELSSISSAKGSSDILFKFPPLGAGPPKLTPVNGDVVYYYPKDVQVLA